MATLIPRVSGPQVEAQMGPQVRNTAQVDLSPAIHAAGQVGKVAAQFFQREVERADTARLMEARTQLSDWLVGIRDPNNPDGMSKYRGENAIAMGDDLTQQLDSRISVIAGRLTPNQQSQFDGIASNFRSNVREQWATYADGQVREAIRAKGEAMNLALSNEAVQYGMGADFGAQQSTLQEIFAANERRDALDGIPAEVTKQSNLARESGIYRKTAEGLLATDPMAAKKYLDSVRERMQAPDLVASTRAIETKVQAIELRAERERERAEAKAQRALDKREAAAQRAMDAFYRQQGAGVPHSVEMLQRLGTLVQGTAVESEFQGAVKEESEIQRVLTSPLSEQADYLQREQAKINSQGGTLQQQNNLTRLKGVIEEGQKQLLDSPLLFSAYRDGETITPLSWGALDNAADATQLGGQLLQRAAIIDGMRKHYGSQVPMAVLLPQDVKSLSDSLVARTPAKQVELLAKLRSSTPNNDIFNAMMKQLAPDSPVVAYAGMLAAKGASQVTLQAGDWFKDAASSSAGDVSAVMLEGNRLLQGKGESKFPLPPDQEFRTEFNRQVGSLFAGRPAAADLAMQAVRAYYTGRAAAEGDVSGVVNGVRLQQAVTAAMGNIADINSRGQVLVPWGMDPDSFEDRVEAEFISTVRSAGLPDSVANNFDKYGLRQRSESTYYVTRGREFLNDKDGKPVILTIAGGGR